MHTISITLPSTTFKRLEEQAQQTGKEPERLMRELIEHALSPRASPSPNSAPDTPGIRSSTPAE
jgi:hypothetical protein